MHSSTDKQNAAAARDLVGQHLQGISAGGDGNDFGAWLRSYRRPLCRAHGVVREGMLGRQLGGVELDLRRDRAFFAGRQLSVADAVAHVVRTIVAVSLRSQMLYPVE